VKKGRVVYIGARESGVNSKNVKQWESRWLIENKIIVKTFNCHAGSNDKEMSLALNLYALLNVLLSDFKKPMFTTVYSSSIATINCLHHREAGIGLSNELMRNAIAAIVRKRSVRIDVKYIKEADNLALRK